MALAMRFFAFISAAFFIWGCYDFFKNVEDNKCTMTYMYEFPEYLKIDLGDQIKEKFPRYNLYFYGEGSYIAKQKKDLKPKGIPVLFIPGNAGSYKQVRSLASVALTKAKQAGLRWRFNYFAADLNEELSGLYGGVLKDQTAFIQYCVEKILQLYEWKTYHPPSSVILVGHSMGGFIARALFAQPSFDSRQVELIITQAAPHQAPVLMLDFYMNYYFTKVNKFWRDHTNNTVKHVAVVSVAGGYRDRLMPDQLTTLNKIVADENAISTQSPAVPKVWTSTDHLCIVWCNELVLATERALFDLVPDVKLGIRRNTFEKMKILRHHFEKNFGPTQFEGIQEVIELGSSNAWQKETDFQWIFSRKKVNQPRYIEVPMETSGGINTLIVSTNQMHTDNWLYACMIKNDTEAANDKLEEKPTTLKCRFATNLSQRSQLLPVEKGKWRKVAHLNITDLAPYYNTFIILVDKSDTQVDVWAEHISRGERLAVIKAPNFWTFLNSYSVLNLTQGQLYYNISVTQLEAVTQAVTVKVKVQSCDRLTGKENVGVMKMRVPWDIQTEYSIIQQPDGGNITLKLQTPMPEDFPGKVQLEMWIHPKCQYEIMIQSSPQETFGQVVRHYGLTLHVYMLMNILLALAYQLKTIAKDGSCPSFQAALAAYGQPFRVLIVANLLSFSLWRGLGPELLDKLRITYPEKYVNPNSIPNPIFGILLFLVAHFFVALLSKLLEIFIKIWGFLLFFTADMQIPGFRFLILPVLTSLVFQLCGVASLLGSLIVCLLQTISAYAKARKGAERSNFHFAFTLLVLWVYLLAINMPSAITWIRNLRYSQTLLDDSAVFSAIITSLIFPIQGLFESKRFVRFAGNSVYIISLLVAMYSIRFMYRIPVFVAAAMLIASACRVTSDVSQDSEEATQTKDKDKAD